MPRSLELVSVLCYTEKTVFIGVIKIVNLKTERLSKVIWISLIYSYGS